MQEQDNPFLIHNAQQKNASANCTSFYSSKIMVLQWMEIAQNCNSVFIVDPSWNISGSD